MECSQDHLIGTSVAAFLNYVGGVLTLMDFIYRLASSVDSPKGLRAPSGIADAGRCVRSTSDLDKAAAEQRGAWVPRGCAPVGGVHFRCIRIIHRLITTRIRWIRLELCRWDVEPHATDNVLPQNSRAR